MLSFDDFKSKLLKKGAPYSAVNGKTVMMAYYTIIEELSDVDTSLFVKNAVEEIKKLKEENMKIKFDLQEEKYILDNQKNEFECKKEEFSNIKKEIFVMETDEARDEIRKAIFFKSSIDVCNGYDRVAYINGLAAILGKKIEMEENDA